MMLKLFVALSPGVPSSATFTRIAFVLAAWLMSGRQVNSALPALSGEIAALANGSNQVQDFRGTQHAALNGQLAAYIRATVAGGAITVTATAEGLAPGTITFETAPGRPGH